MTTAADFLQVYDLKLTAMAPLFIGNGHTILKKSYLYNPKSGKISIFDEEKFFALLFQRNLFDPFERFMLGRQNNLFTFLTQDCHMAERDWAPAVRYCLDAGAALDARHSLSDIQCFIRNIAGQIYVPGSSVKGALRTVLLQQMIRQDGEHSKLTPAPKGKYEVIPEENYLHTLQLNLKQPDDAVNSIMRGIQVSDSLPISDENVTLAAKWDAQTNGEIKKLNVCRESLRLGTEIRMRLTLDQSVLKGALTKESLMKAISEFDDYYRYTYLMKFKQPVGAADIVCKNCLFLGGGAGFFSKSLVYPYLGAERGLKKTVEIMRSAFRNHRHEGDEYKGISPHTLKYTQYGKAFYLMGMCGVEIR